MKQSEFAGNSSPFAGDEWPRIVEFTQIRAAGIMKGTTMSQALHLGHIKVKAKLAGLCRRYQVRELLVFGSAARGEMRPDSDIDLLVEFLPDAHVSLIEHAGLMLDLAKLLGEK